MGCLKLHTEAISHLKIIHSANDVFPKKSVKKTCSERQFKYNGKELNDELGLDWYDYGARNYDASLGRWMNLDPLAENYYYDSPYVYTTNNPVLYIDPDGRFWKKNNDGTWTAEAGDSAWTLHEDAGISFERAKEILANTPKDNPQGNMGVYEDEDGNEKSAVDPGDVVRVDGEEVKTSDGSFVVVPDDAGIDQTDSSVLIRPIDWEVPDNFDSRENAKAQLVIVKEAAKLVSPEGRMKRAVAGSTYSGGVRSTSRGAFGSRVKANSASKGYHSPKPQKTVSPKKVNARKKRLKQKRAARKKKNRRS